MSDVFELILQNAIVTSFLILGIIVLKFFIRKLPKKFTYILWLIVLLKLCFPFTYSINFETDTLINTYYTPSNMAENIVTNLDNVYNYTDNIIVQSQEMQNSTSTLTSLTIKQFASKAWIIGVLLFAIYTIVSYVLFKNNIKYATLVEDNIYESDRIDTAFLLGIIKPKIYIPIGLNQDEKKHIVLHEQSHQKRYDYIVKPLFYFACVLYWFNPIVWLSYFLMTKNMEMSCDELATKEYNLENKKSYSVTLLNINRKYSFAFPLGFSESNIKSRVKNILEFKKKSPILLSIVLIVSICILLLCMFNINNSDTPFDIVRSLKDTTVENLTEFAERGNNNYVLSMTVGNVSNKSDKMFFVDFLEKTNKGYVWSGGGGHIDKDLGASSEISSDFLISLQFLNNEQIPSPIIFGIVPDDEIEEIIINVDSKQYKAEILETSYERFYYYVFDNDLTVKEYISVHITDRIKQKHSINVTDSNKLNEINSGHQIYLYDTTPEIVDENIDKNTYIYPMNGTITSAFGYRINPITNEENFHSGIDIGACESDDIVSIGDGLVEFVGVDDEYGNYVIVSYGNSLSALYAQCSEILIKKDDIVFKNDIIAKVGSTGNANGPHLHFEIRVDNEPVNPMIYLEN